MCHISTLKQWLPVEIQYFGNLGLNKILLKVICVSNSFFKCGY